MWKNNLATMFSWKINSGHRTGFSLWIQAKFQVPIMFIEHPFNVGKVTVLFPVLFRTIKFKKRNTK